MRVPGFAAEPKIRGAATAIALSLLCGSIALAAGDGAWIALAPPAGRYDHAAFYDSSQDRMVVALGEYHEPFVYNFDIWSLSLGPFGSWRQIQPGGSGFGGTATGMVYDSRRDRLSRAAFSTSLLTSIEFAGIGRWTSAAIAGTPPSDRFGIEVIYDAGADRIVCFGGRVDDTTFVNDVWAVDLSGAPTWVEIVSSGARPEGRTGFSLAYDPLGARMILFGGYRVLPDYSSIELDDVWTLSLDGPPTWTRLTPSGSAPGARSGAAVMFDPPRNRMLMQGGSTGDATLWALSLGVTPAWSALSTSGPAPGAIRRGHSMLYDSRRDRMLHYGGLRGGAYPSSELRALDLATNSWVSLADTRPAPRHEHSAVALMFTRLVSVTPASLPEEAVPVSVAPNPAVGDMTFSLMLPCAASVRLTIFDLAGRSRAEPFSGALGAGPHEVRWAREARRASGLGPGVYFYELRVGSQRVSRRMVVVG